jgi:hypothetical protein
MWRIEIDKPQPKIRLNGMYGVQITVPNLRIIRPVRC